MKDDVRESWALARSAERLAKRFVQHVKEKGTEGRGRTKTQAREHALYQWTMVIFVTRALRAIRSVLLLCKRGYAREAGMVVRHLFEVYINARYISHDAVTSEERAKEYLDFFFVQRKKINDELRALPTHQRAGLEDLILKSTHRMIRRFGRVKNRYTGKKRGLRDTWSGKNLRQMAEEPGEDAKFEYVIGYALDSHQVHADAMTVDNFVTRGNGSDFLILQDDEPACAHPLRPAALHVVRIVELANDACDAGLQPSVARWFQELQSSR